MAASYRVTGEIRVCGTKEKDTALRDPASANQQQGAMTFIHRSG
jgi:hypothetical protein